MKNILTQKNVSNKQKHFNLVKRLTMDVIGKNRTMHVYLEYVFIKKTNIYITFLQVSKKSSILDVNTIVDWKSFHHEIHFTFCLFCSAL